MHACWAAEQLGHRRGGRPIERPPGIGSGRAAAPPAEFGRLAHRAADVRRGTARGSEHRRTPAGSPGKPGARRQPKAASPASDEEDPPCTDVDERHAARVGVLLERRQVLVEQPRRRPQPGYDCAMGARDDDRSSKASAGRRPRSPSPPEARAKAEHDLAPPMAMRAQPPERDLRRQLARRGRHARRGRGDLARRTRARRGRHARRGRRGKQREQQHE